MHVDSIELLSVPGLPSGDKWLASRVPGSIGRVNATRIEASGSFINSGSYDTAEGHT